MVGLQSRSGRRDSKKNLALSRIEPLEEETDYRLEQFDRSLREFRRLLSSRETSLPLNTFYSVLFRFLSCVETNQITPPPQLRSHQEDGGTIAGSSLTVS